MQAAIAASSVWESARSPSCRVTVDWNKDGTYEDDISAYVIAIEVTDEAVSRDAAGSSVAASVASKAVVVVNNMSGRFSPNRGGSVVGTSGGYLAPITIELGFGSDYLPQLTGYILRPQENAKDRTVTFGCVDRWVALKRKRLSSPPFRAYRVDQLISEWLTRSGFTAAPHNFTSSLEVSERIVDWAWLDDDPVADDLIRLVEADGGIVWFTKAGVLAYKTATWPARDGASGYTFTTQWFSDLAPRWDFDSVYEEVIVRVRPRVIAVTQPIWSTDEDITVEPASTRDIVAHFREPSYALAKPEYNTKPELSDWLAVTSANQVMESGGASQVTVTLRTPAGADIHATTPPGAHNAQSVTVRLVNAHASQRAYVRKLQIRGNPIVSIKEFEEKDAAATVNQTLSIDNIYIQNRAHAQAIAKARRYRHETPRYALSIKGVPAQPHLEVYDRVTVTETATTGISADFYVVRVLHRFGGGAYTQDFDLVKRGSYTPREDYFKINTTALGAGRLWY
jgi:hypothetical protein